MPIKPRVEIVFKRGKPVSAFLHLRENPTGPRKTIAIRPPMTAHYDSVGQAVGLEIPLPTTVSTAAINEALHELGAEEVSDAELLGLRMV